MADEIEAKMKVADLDAVRQTLRRLGAEPRGSALETNVFYDTPDNRMLSAGHGLRIRTACHDDGSERSTVTFKGPLKHATLKQREEIEFTVDDPEAAAAIFQRMGYKPVLTFEKRRESWLFLGCKIELDRLPVINTFVEIEGPDEATVLAARKALGLDALSPITTGYATMLVQYAQSQGNEDRLFTL